MQKPERSAGPEISVIVPAYREADHLFASISTIISEVSATAPDFELIIIDDGSPDDTWAEILKLAATHSEVRGIRLSRNFGKEYALSAGLEDATGQAVIILDADLQHPPSIIHSFIERWRRGGVDVVEGRKRDRESEPKGRRAVSKIFNRLAGWLTKLPFEGASDFKLLDRKVVDAWARLPERRCFFRGMVSWVGFRKACIEFDVDPRVSGQSKWSTSTLLRLASRAIISYSALPLRIIHVASIAFLVFAAILAARAFYVFATGRAVGGATTIILLILITSGLGLGCLGVIAEYLAAIYEEVKGRPRYLIAERTLPAAALQRGGVSHTSVYRSS